MTIIILGDEMLLEGKTLLFKNATPEWSKDGWYFEKLS